MFEVINIEDNLGTDSGNVRVQSDFDDKIIGELDLRCEIVLELLQFLLEVVVALRLIQSLQIPHILELLLDFALPRPQQGILRLQALQPLLQVVFVT